MVRFLPNIIVEPDLAGNMGHRKEADSYVSAVERSTDLKTAKQKTYFLHSLTKMNERRYEHEEEAYKIVTTLATVIYTGV